MTDSLVPRALGPLPPEDAERFHAAFEAALDVLGSPAVTDGDGSVLYPPEGEDLVNQARAAALRACGLPFVMVGPDYQFRRQ